MGRGQALLTDLRRSGKPAPHHWLLFGIGKEKAAEDVLLYALLSKYILAMMYFSVAFSIRMFLVNDHINLSGVRTCHFG